MSKKIFELQFNNTGAIIDSNKESFMKEDRYYTQELENLVLKLLPYYDRYFQVIGAPKPPLEISVLKKIKKKQPALFQSWPLQD